MVFVKTLIRLIGLCLLLASCAHQSERGAGPAAHQQEPMITEGLSRAKQSEISPSDGLQRLIDGNNRFLTGGQLKRDLLAQAQSRGVSGQFPFASIVSCADSRADPALLFDQGISDIFVARVEGNVINADVLGSLEYAAKISGSKAIVVLGHNHCGAVKGACDGLKLGNFTQLINRISPAVKATPSIGGPDRSSKNYEFVDAVAVKNVELSLKAIRTGSPLLKELENKGQIKIVGAMLDIETGKVTFLGEPIGPGVKTTIKTRRAEPPAAAE
ncbi:MAG TPA: carbonic anhydrase family protein [Cellvibrionaceae bacterium]|nr:carbonic anhydrase family protein [Cellvibrionaceae bacterium]HNG61560.1 carbonic anhydrase family protein [Cellvibrionaceae bacterium]